MRAHQRLPANDPAVIPHGPARSRLRAAAIPGTTPGGPPGARGRRTPNIGRN